jgi:hypothetical protein
MVKQNKLYIGFVIVLVICLICILFREKMYDYYEKFACPVDTDGENHIQCYYNRCINNYKIEERGGSVPKYDIDNGKALVLYYLKNQDIFPLYGCGGWINQVNKQSIVPEWAFYIFKLYRYYLGRGRYVGESHIRKQNEVVKLLKKYLDNNVGDLNYYKRHEPTKTYLNYLNKSTSNDEKYEKNEIFIHQQLLLYYLLKIQKIKASIGPDKDVGLLWGVPYLTYVNTDGEVEKFTATTNVPNFNYKYKIAFKVRPDKREKLGDDIGLATSFNNKEYFYLKYDSNFTLNSDSSEGTEFIIEVGSDCNQYLRLKTTDNKYVRLSNDTIEVGGKDGSIKLCLSNDINTELELDIDSVFVPPKITTSKKGEPVNMIFEANETQFFAYLGLIKNSKSTNFEPKVIRGTYDDQHINNIGFFTAEIGDDDVNDNTYMTYFEGIVFERTERILGDVYGYQERRIARPIGTEGDGVVEDRGIIKMSELDKDMALVGMKNAGENITTNQKLFPVMNRSDSDLNNINTNCVYTGPQTNDETIKQICGEKNNKCYGEFISEPDSDGNSYKMGYVGKQCNRHLKYFDNISENFDERIDRGKVKCYDIGTVIDDTDEGINVRKCYLPRVHTKLPDNDLKSLNPRKKFDNPNYCQSSLDYGVLDGPFAMYNNNAQCIGEYELNGAPLKNENKQCENDIKCEFNAYTEDNKNFLLTAPFGELMIKNQETNQKLRQLKSKVQNFQKQLQDKTDEDARRDALLVGKLNDFKVTKMQDNINRLNNHALEELLRNTNTM